MSLPLREENKKYSYEDYMEWKGEERWELIKGIPYDMTPAPSRTHQRILGDLYRQFSTYLLRKQCEVYIAPFDVRLQDKGESDEDITTVVQPDLVVVCDLSKLDERGCKGAPDLIVEVLSPSTKQKDMKEKLISYEEAGVRDYWIVQPSEKIVSVFSLRDDGQYGKPAVYSEEDEIKVGLFDDLVIFLDTAFRK